MGAVNRFFRRRRDDEPPRPSPTERYLIVGVGNPGSAYAGNRHNVGARTVNRLARQFGVELANSKLAGTAEVTVDGRRVLLVKPRTYVNESGRAVAALLRRHGIPAARLVVVYDDLDLPPGRVRVRARGSHGGHNGMRSIVGAIGTTEFPRVRVGIGRPKVDGAPSWDPEAVASYVLSNPPLSERDALEAGVGLAAEGALAIITDGIEAAMNRFNRGNGEGAAQG